MLCAAAASARLPLTPSLRSASRSSRSSSLAPLLLPFRAMSSSTSSPSTSPPPLSLQLVPGRTRIGWIGTGVMGASMCGHLLRSASPAYPTTVFNRTRAKTEALQGLGAVVVGSAEEVASSGVDVLFTMLGYPSDVRSVYLGDGSGDERRGGVLAHMRAGSLVVDFTTSEPTLAVEVAAAAAAKGIGAIDAPVSGGDVGARNATLSIMVGGDASTLELLLPLLQCMGKSIIRCGGPGCGQHTKMVNQTLIASAMVGLCEALLYAHRAGLDLPTTIQAVSAGAAGSWSLSNLGPRIIASAGWGASTTTGRSPHPSMTALCLSLLMVRRNFDPGFYVEHFVKDLSIVLAESRRMKLSLPGLSLAYSLYMALMAQGGEKMGTQALYTALEKINGIDPPKP